MRLFHRTTRKVDLSGGQATSLAACERAARPAWKALLGIRDVASRVSGDVTVACIHRPCTFSFRTSSRLIKRYPGIVVRLIDQGANDILTVVRSEADFGINYVGTQDPQLDFDPILREPFVLACTAGRRSRRNR